MKKHPLRTVGIALLLLALLVCPGSERQASGAEPEAEATVWAAATGSFALLTALFSTAEETPAGELCCPGYDQLSQLQQHLQTGFTEALAAAIVEEYFYAGAANAAVYLRATDSLPMLEEKDRDACRVLAEDGAAEVLCLFRAVYEPDDIYLYRVELVRGADGGYLISALAWQRLQTVSCRFWR